jgi:NAD(P)-dependent dehydrogenase (short-subunit alcohol dehydrogenase family)
VTFERPTAQVLPAGTSAAVLLTGVSRAGGIGAAIARRLARDGARLLLTGWPAHDAEQPWGADPDGGTRVRDELRGAGATVGYVPADLADPDAPGGWWRQRGTSGARRRADRQPRPQRASRCST